MLPFKRSVVLFPVPFSTCLVYALPWRAEQRNFLLPRNYACAESPAGSCVRAPPVQADPAPAGSARRLEVCVVLRRMRLNDMGSVYVQKNSDLASARASAPASAPPRTPPGKRRQTANGNNNNNKLPKVRPTQHLSYANATHKTRGRHAHATAHFPFARYATPRTQIPELIL